MTAGICYVTVQLAVCFGPAEDNTLYERLVTVFGGQSWMGLVGFSVKLS
jgi:hypothetical protein